VDPSVETAKMGTVYGLLLWTVQQLDGERSCEEPAKRTRALLESNP
jgi:hypothetical protein